MGIAFEPGKANFTRLSPEGHLFITRVGHKAFIDVNETGTVAAAATNIGIGRVLLPETKFVFNKPFIFVIYEKSSSAILFTGIIYNPIIE